MPGQEAITAQYDRVAPCYRVLSPLFLITPLARRRGVAALGLRAGDTVLEVGAGTGRNLPYLVDAVGPGGVVIGVDLSARMLAEAAKMVGRRGWSNVELVRADATALELDRHLDAILFSLSWSVIPNPVAALRQVWERLRPGGRVAVMDLGITETPLRPVLAPVARQLNRLGPGRPDARPWDDLAPFGEVATDRFLHLYYVCAVTKAGAPQRSSGSP
ncbi:MAG: methyltransferase domain-containing protein [Actinobacteria bacterium]|nr:methyltransferase domain-containing protein [Actinomycetota bacterium]